MNHNIILIVQGIDIGGKNGGAESFGLRLGKSLSENGWKVSLFVIRQHGTEIEKFWYRELESGQVSVQYLDESGNSSYIKLLITLWKYLSDESFIIVHSHNQVGTIVSIPFVFLGKIKILVRTAHASLEFGSGSLATAAKYIFRDFFYVFFVKSEIGVSKEIVSNLNKRLLARMIKKRATRIPNSVPEPQFRGNNQNAIAIRKRKLSDDPWIIISIGMLNLNKNFDVLLSALSIILKEIPNTYVALIGEGQEYLKLKELAEYCGVSQHVWFLKQQIDINSLLYESNLFILPSKSEGISTVILEAMQSGLPVIAADIPGNRELITDGFNGYLFSTGNVTSLAEKVLTLYHDKELYSLFVERSKNIPTQYSISDVTQKYISLYNSLLEKNVRAS